MVCTCLGSYPSSHWQSVSLDVCKYWWPATGPGPPLMDGGWGEKARPCPGQQQLATGLGWCKQVCQEKSQDRLSPGRRLIEPRQTPHTPRPLIGQLLISEASDWSEHWHAADPSWHWSMGGMLGSPVISDYLASNEMCLKLDQKWHITPHNTKLCSCSGPFVQST